jgi:hypothetical protein
MNIIKRDAKSSLFIEIDTFLQPQRSLSFLPHLIIEIKIRSCFTSIIVNAKMILGSEKKLQSSMVLYIGPSKKVNDYYTPRA